MLGKQAWRFLTKPDSLVSHRARYYPKGTFYDAKVGNNLSFCWRSIMAAQNMICSGTRRRIGNGKTTLIWDHPWLQDEQGPMIHTDKPPYLNNAAVVGLIDHNTQTWDADILADIFNPTDVTRIKKIPVSPDYEAMWYWHDDQGGNYTVKSGYKTIVGNLNDNTGTHNLLRLWKLKVPPNGKHSYGRL
ncbi:PREDICTED: uncharacterized protein LOC109154900 [Ipomoea nil]|uniref:uncharacterized protein LOC109154900 n=1 Tax=Ipomoea nil TaxID=35883 RepID=UPI0009010753|nr:PREDICTED: uncharacterized protein LOC109154900 [Ipomoea nil]